MPNCTASEVPFSKLGRRKIDVRFDGGAISSDGGLLLLREVERRLGLLKTVAEALPDPRSPLLVKHRTEQLLRQRVFGLCQGYEDLNDHDSLRDDLALQTALGRDTAAASSPTLCRFENRADRATAVSTHSQAEGGADDFVMAHCRDWQTVLFFGFDLCFSPPERRLDQPQGSGGLGEDCLST